MTRDFLYREEFCKILNYCVCDADMDFREERKNEIGKKNEVRLEDNYFERAKECIKLDEATYKKVCGMYNMRVVNKTKKRLEVIYTNPQRLYD